MTTIAVIVIYLVGIGTMFQLADALDGKDMYGHDSKSFRWFASCFWPVTASIAAGIAIARKAQLRVQQRATRPPRAVVNDRQKHTR